MIKKVAKSVARRGAAGLKKTIIAVPILRKAAVRAKHLLVPELANIVRESYNHHAYYPTITEYVQQTSNWKQFKHQPLISLVMPTYNTPHDFLKDCIESVLLQSYPNWELCIADDASPDKAVGRIVKDYAAKDARIKFVQRKTNGHISEATNSAIEIASGTFITLVDHDDMLWPNALYEVVKVINDDPKVDLIYTDEDKIGLDDKIHSYPFLKPDWSPEFLESCNYITHLSTIRSTVLRDIGGLRKGYEGAQDWDLFIRIGEVTQQIIHIPKILYSWRIHEASTAANTDAKPYVYEAQLKLLNDHVMRTGRRGVVETGIITQHRTIKYEVPSDTMLAVFVTVSSELATKRLLRSLQSHVAGAPIELYLLSRTSLSTQSIKEYSLIVAGTTVRFIKSGAEPEWQLALDQTRADYFAFIDDRAEIISDNWARTAVGDAQLTGVGLVGPVLLKSDKETVLSAGIGIGYGQGYCDMLSGEPFNDPHYTRGLYVKSRRNVSAVNPVVYFTTRRAIEAVKSGKLTTTTSAIDLALVLLDVGLRHVYTPYVKAVYHGVLEPTAATNSSKVEDKYLNPNFNHLNSRMEVRE